MKRILVLNYFSAIAQSASGRELRYFNLYSRLSRYFDITLLSSVQAHCQREVKVHSPAFREHCVPQEQIHDQLQIEVAKEGIAEEYSGLVCALAARQPNAYHEAYLELLTDADCIIHESPYTLKYDLLIGLDRRPRIFDCHTTEPELLAQLCKGPEAESYLSCVSDLEKRLIQSSELSFVVSQPEATRLGEKYGVSPARFRIAGNGINPEAFLPRATEVEEFIADDASLQPHIAETGPAHVTQQLRWDSIARRMAQDINDLLEHSNRPLRRSILLLNDFPVAQPRGGGQVRINRLYSNLANYYQITLVCLIHAGDCGREEIAKGFVEIRIPKTDSHRIIDQDLHWINSPGDIVNFLEAPKNPLLKKLVVALHARSDAVILSHPYMAGLIADLEGVPVIYEAHNTESTLKRQLLADHPSSDALIAVAEECERMAIKLSSEMILVSEAEQDSMVLLGGKLEHMHVIPNGVDVPPPTSREELLDHVLAGLEGKPLIVFIGSAHAPNVEAAAYIIDVLAPKFPECIFGIVGSVCIYFKTAPFNVLLFGSQDEKSKDTVIALAHIAINPVQSGSGSNLKLAEFFAKSLPTLTTTFGARGYPITDGEHAIVCSIEDFPERLRNLLRNPGEMERLGRNAFAFARENLDWSLQAERFHNLLERTIFAEKKC
jgi:glycosyltransferase involved in cell wall biosynthesis